MVGTLLPMQEAWVLSLVKELGSPMPQGAAKNLGEKIKVKRVRMAPTLSCMMASSGLHSQSYGFSSSHVWMWELDYKEGWAVKNWYFWTVVLEKTLESPLDYKEIQPVKPKGNQACMFIVRTDAEASIVWPPDAMSRFIGEDPDARKDWRQEEKGMTEDGMVEWHHWLKGHQFEQDTGVGDGQGSLVYCSPWGGRELDMTERLNNNLKLLENNGYISLCYALYPCCWSVLLTLNIKINIRKKE